MALEDLTGTKYLDDLNSSNPAAGDNVSEGDDHIRGIKNVLKLTFPNIDAAINATPTELNYVDGVTSAIQTQFDAITANNWVTNARMADDAIGVAELSATGTASSSTYLRGDNSWSTVDALPSQTGHAGKYLTTNATTASWATLDTDANTTTKGLYEHEHTIDANYSITSGSNAMSAGPITISSGISVTVPTGSTWVIVYEI